MGATVWGAGVASLGGNSGGVVFLNTQGQEDSDAPYFRYDEVNRTFHLGLGITPDTTDTDSLFGLETQWRYRSSVRNGMSLYTFGSDTPTRTNLSLSRFGGTPDAVTAAVSGDVMGAVEFLANTGSTNSLQSVAEVQGIASGASASLGGYLKWLTKTDNGTLVERMRLTNNLYVGDFGQTYGTFLLAPALGGDPTFSVVGPNTNHGIAYGTKGNYGHNFYTDLYGTPRLQFRVRGDLAATSWLDAFGSDTNGPFIRAEGAVADINAAFYSKGNSGVYIGTAQAIPQLLVSGPTTAINQLNVQGSTTGNRVIITASGSDANIGLSLTNKGTAIMQWSGQTVGTTVGAAGGASALPATPVNYLTINVNGTDRKIPLYNV